MLIYFKNFLHFILSRLVSVFFNFNELCKAREMRYMNTITWGILCLLIFCTCLIFMTFLWRNVQSKVQLRNVRHVGKIEEDLILYLYDEKFAPVVLEQFARFKGYKRQLLLGVITQMESQFVGKLSIQLKHLFRKVIDENSRRYKQYRGRVALGMDGWFPFKEPKNY
jgi:hypothetical protein